MQKAYQTLHLASVDSTNAYLKRRQKELSDSTFAYADYQSKGKGRGDHAWSSEDKMGLLFSLLLKADSSLALGGMLSLVAAVSIARNLAKSLQKADIFLKWPNDIYVGKRKVCGILLEASLPEYLIIGAGINVNQLSFEGEYHIPPTSMAIVAGRGFDIEAFKDEVFSSLLEDIALAKKDMASFLSYYRAHDYLKGKKVSLICEGNRIEGIVEGVDEEFALLLDSRGKKVAVRSGQIDVIEP